MSSEYIFGIHDVGGEEYLRAAEKTGWIVFSEVLGHDPNDLSGKDYSSFSLQGLGVIVRLNNGYYPQGTLPPSSEYANFARRCANFVAASQGCSHWVIGNEMNYVAERPAAAATAARPHPDDSLADDPTLRSLPERFNALFPTSDREGTTHLSEGGELITPQLYASCYGMCRQSIHELQEHERDQVLIGAVAPWNSQTVYPGNASGDWIKYFQDILLQCGATGCDGITLHTYTHGANPTLILDNSKLPNFPNYSCHFQAYRDFMQAIPVNMRHLPVYITETDQGGPWENANRGWVQAAFAEIDRWNRQNGQQIHALVLYRWPQLDRWHIKGKDGVIEDFRNALRHDYRWQKETDHLKAVNRTTPLPEIQPADNEPEAPEAEDTEEMELGRGMVYRVQWLKGRPPSPLLAGQHVNFPVTVRNSGTMAWPAQGSQQVALSYHFSQKRERLPYPDGRPMLTPLPHDVAPGEEVTFDAQMILPDQPGNYTLVLDLIRGGEDWFEDMQSDILTRWLSVGEADPEPVSSAPFIPDAELPADQDWQRPEPAPRPVSTPDLHLEGEAGSSSATQQTAVVDIADTLPRGDHPFARRTPDQIRRLVICHTAAPPGVPLVSIAEAHISQGYPGIAYHYFVLASGDILQVSALDAVVNDEAEWSLTGINICLEGNFDDEAPPSVQVTAAAQLCALLLPKFHLNAQSIVGLCELLDTSSPGSTFNAGPAWKHNFHERVVDSLTNAPLAEGAKVEGDAPIVPDNMLPASDSESVAAAKPAMDDVIGRLPRDPQRMVQRRLEDVEFIVINHTAAPPITPLQTIATAFHRRLPGILYQYFISSNGAVYQTQPLTEVVDGRLPYIARAINIGFAGKFDDDIPTPAQIRSGRDLIAWLLEEIPQLTLASIRGVNEFISHTSPGEQWLQGRRWKDILITAVRTGTDGATTVAKAAAREDRLDPPSLRQTGEGETSERQVVAQPEGQPEIGQLESVQQESGRQVERPQIQDITLDLPRHPTLRYRTRPLSGIDYLAVHHTALPTTIGPERIAQAHIDEDLTRGKRAWPGVGYHFFIPADGEILQTQPVEARAYHVGRHNYYSVGVVFAGSFMNGYLPTDNQIRSGALLIAWLLQELEIPLSHIMGHREFSNNYTACPGSEWLSGSRWRDILLAQIGKVQSEIPPYHYILFPTEEAKEKAMAEAGDYFHRFSPIAGTRLNDALRARYVTLVGTGASVRSEELQRLADAGVVIDRLNDSEEISAAHRLMQLVHDGRRFHTLLES